MLGFSLELGISFARCSSEGRSLLTPFKLLPCEDEGGNVEGGPGLACTKQGGSAIIGVLQLALRPFHARLLGMQGCWC